MRHTVSIGNKIVILECSNAFPWWQHNPSRSIHSGFMFFIKNFHNFRFNFFFGIFLELYIKKPQPKFWNCHVKNLITFKIINHDYQFGNLIINLDTLLFIWKQSCLFGNCILFPRYFVCFRITSEVSKLKLRFLTSKRCFQIIHEVSNSDVFKYMCVSSSIFVL